MIDEQKVQEITDQANNIINRQCPLIEKDIKTYQTRAILEAWLEKKCYVRSARTVKTTQQGTSGEATT